MKHIRFGAPDLPGMYMCYVSRHPKERVLSKNDNTFPSADMKLIYWGEDEDKEKSWGSGLTVLAWIGPIPILSIDELSSDKEAISRVFCIGTLKGASKYQWTRGSFPEQVFALLKSGKEGEFIFQINTRATLPIPICKYNTRLGIWRDLNEKAKKKYTIILKMKMKKNEKKN